MEKYINEKMLEFQKLKETYNNQLTQITEQNNQLKEQLATSKTQNKDILQQIQQKQKEINELKSHEESYMDNTQTIHKTYKID